MRTKKYIEGPMCELIIRTALEHAKSLTTYSQEVAASIRELRARYRIKITPLGYVSDEDITKLYREVDASPYPTTRGVRIARARGNGDRKSQKDSEMPF